MSISNRRLEYEKAQEFGDKMDVFVKEQTGSWRSPVVSTEKVAEEFDIDEQEVIERLTESDLVLGKEIADTHVWW